VKGCSVLERDPKTGRFLKGNKAAVGNKGNTKPKWGNKNARKHGFYCTFLYPRILEDGRLVIYKVGKTPVAIRPEGYYQDKDGAIWIDNDIIEKLEEKGFVPDWPFE
jgi:hypothetical protein